MLLLQMSFFQHDWCDELENLVLTIKTLRPHLKCKISSEKYFQCINNGVSYREKQQSPSEITRLLSSLYFVTKRQVFLNVGGQSNVFLLHSALSCKKN
jgi:hypothetical protein